VTVVNQILKAYNFVIVNAAQPGAPPVLPLILSPGPNSSVVEDQVTVTGTAIPNTIVTIHVHSAREIVVKAVTNSAGAFVYDFSKGEIPSGDHQVYASIDEPQGSLVGPALAFSVLASIETSMPNSSVGIGVGAWSIWILLFAWLVAIGFAVYLFYRAFIGKGFGNVDFLIAMFSNLTNFAWWRSLPRKFASLIASFWKRK
jgi:hypothetical protein